MIVSDIVRAGAVDEHRRRRLAPPAHVRADRDRRVRRRDRCTSSSTSPRSARSASVVPSRQLPAAAAAEQARYSTVTIVAPPLGGVALRRSAARSRSSPTRSRTSSRSSRCSRSARRFRKSASTRRCLCARSSPKGFRWLWGHNVPAHVRGALHLGERRLRGDVPRADRRRPPAGALGRGDRRAHRRGRLRLARRARSRRRGSRSGCRCASSSSAALWLAALHRRVRREAEHLRPARRRRFPRRSSARA